MRNYLIWFSKCLLGLVILHHPSIGICQNNQVTIAKEFHQYYVSNTDESSGSKKSQTGSNPQGGFSSSGYIVHMSDNIISLDVDRLFPFYDGYAVIQKGEAYALINASGTIVVPFNKYVFNLKSNSDFGFTSGFCVVMDVNTNRWGMLNNKLELFIPCIYAHVQPVDNNGRIWVGKEFEASTNGQYILDSKGSLIGEVSAIGKNFQNNGIARVFSYQLKGDLVLCRKSVRTPSGSQTKYGFANLNGTSIVIPLEYDEAWPFSENMAIVGRRDEFGIMKYGFINTQNKLVIPFKFTKRPGRFHNGRACVEPLDKSEFNYGYIDTRGEVVIKIKNEPNCNINLIRGGMGSEIPIDMYSLSDFTNGFSFWSRDCRNDKKSSGLIVMDTSGNMNHYNSLLIKNGWIDGYLPQDRFIHNEVLLRGVGDRMHAIADIHGNILIKTSEDPNLRAYIRTTFEPVSKLAVVRMVKQNVNIDGYVNRQGEIVIVKGPEGKW
jgi:hypothetical protein